MERLTNKREADAQRKDYERRLANGYPRNIPEERFLRLAAYEDTGLTPEEVPTAVEMAQIYSIIEENKRYRALNVTVEHLKELAEADKEGRLVVLPCIKYCERYGWQNISWDSKYGICAGSHDTREEAEKALRGV